MSRGPIISDFERGQIATLKGLGYSANKIAKHIHRSRSLVIGCLNRGVENPPKKRGGPKKKLSDRDIRAIQRKASNSTRSSSEIKAELNLNVSSRTIRRAMHACPHLKHEKMLTKPALKPGDKPARLAFARDHMSWKGEWEHVIFSDEKKWNMDGPDGYAYYWHDLRKENLIFSKRSRCGGSLMVWIGVSFDFKAHLYVLDKTFTSAEYTLVLNTCLMPVVNQMLQSSGQQPTFQHDGASAHRAHATTRWLNDRNILILHWPARSPDLNITENLFGTLSQDILTLRRSFEML